MLNQGLVAYPYVETTTAPVAGGILEDMPRLDYSNGSCPSLLLEPSRTNLANKSEYILGTGFSNVGPPIYNANAAISLEGLNNAAQISALNTGHRFRLLVGVISGSHTASIFLKSDGTTSELLFQNSDTNSYVKISVASSGGVIISETNSVEDSDVVSYGNGWYRVWFTFTAGLGSTLLQLYPSYTTPSSTSYFYGLQLEEGSYPTSYIPTYGVSQTRLKDNATASSVIDVDNDFTFYFESTLMAEGYGDKYFDTIGGFGYLSGYNIGNSNLRHRLGSNYVFTAPEGIFKYLIRKDSTNMKFYLNGVLEYTITPSLTGTRDLNLLGGKVYKTLLFPTALSDEACIELTTI